MDHRSALCMMIMASIFLSGLDCSAGLFRGLVWVGSISYWVGLGWITENGLMSMSGLTSATIDPGFKCGFPDLSRRLLACCQNVTDSFHCRSQSFRQVL